MNSPFLSEMDTPVDSDRDEQTISPRRRRRQRSYSRNRSFHFRGEEEEEKKISINPKLFFCKSDPKKELPGEYLCLACKKVVWEPLSCSVCESLTCKRCVQKNPSNKKCPAGCRGDMNNTHKLVNLHLKEFEFKCNFYPDCEEIVKYEKIPEHNKNCEARKLGC